MTEIIAVTQEGDLYRADIEGLPDCTEWADTEREARELAQDSIDCVREHFGEASPV